MATNTGNIRIIPRLDIKGPNLIKGIQLDGHRVLGTPEVFAEIYYREGADELIFYDTVASLYQRNSLVEYIRKTAEKIFIPLTVAGGIRSIQDIQQLLRAGADKVAINTAAIENPSLLSDASKFFGSQCIVASVEFYKQKNGFCEVWVDYGRQPTGVDAYDWVRRAVDLGAGEILLTSINQEGMGRGFDIDFTSKVSETVPVPVVVCGGAGKKEDFLDVIRRGKADAVSAASCFHYYYAAPPGDDRRWMSFNEPRLRMGEDIDSGNIDFLREGYGGFKDVQTDRISLPEIKKYLCENGVPIRPLPKIKYSPERKTALP